MANTTYFMRAVATARRRRKRYMGKARAYRKWHTDVARVQMYVKWARRENSTVAKYARIAREDARKYRAALKADRLAIYRYRRRMNLGFAREDAQKHGRHSQQHRLSQRRLARTRVTAGRPDYYR